MDLNLRQIRTFLGVVRCGSFAAAAKNLHATQAAISVRIQELEQALGVKLFVRGPQRVKLTPNGKLLVPFAEQLLALASTIQKEVGELDALSGVIRLGVCEPVALTWLPGLIGALRQQLPKVNIEIDRDLTTGLMKKLESGDIDVALVAGPVPVHNYLSRSLGYVRFSWLASPDIRIPANRLTPSEMKDMPLLSLSQQPYEYPAIERWFERSFQHNYVITCNDIRILIQLLVAGLGVSLLAEICCRAEIGMGLLNVIDTSPAVPPVEFFAIWRRDRNQPLFTAVSTIAAEQSRFEFS